MDTACGYCHWCITNSNLFKMTEREIILLGFKSEEIKEHDEDDSYYYSYRIARGLEFISKASNDEGEWYIEFFNTDPCIRIYNFANAQKLINEIEKYKCG